MAGGDWQGMYPDKASYDAAMAAWQQKKANGDPFPGPMPRQAIGGQIEDSLAQAGYPTQGIPNQGMWQGLTQAGANAAPNANPYSSIVANQARPAQEALYAQMQAQQAGPSVAAMQGQRAQGQNLQHALGAGAGRGAMLQAGQVGAGLAADTGAGRLAEQLRGSAGIGGMVNGVRGADLGVAGAQSQAGLQQRGLDDQMRQFYAAQGAGLANSVGRNQLEAEKLRQRLLLQAKKNDIAKGDALASEGSTIAGGAMK